MAFNQPGVLQMGIKKTMDSFQEVQGKVGDRVLINVGGKRHETYLSTISNYQDTRLFWIAETASKMADFDPHSNEFFFDRHPGCFENILNFCRTGKLHCPNDVCGPLFEEELSFWGIDELQMEPCCWGTYTQHRNAHKHLKMFDAASDMGGECPEQDLHPEKVNSSRLMQRICRWRASTWAMLEEPYSSRYAQAAAVVNLVVILLSIASFCIETMPIAIPHDLVFRRLEYFYCGYFTLDFIVRLFCCPSYKTFIISLYNWIDFISILQFYVNFWANSDTFDFLFVLRLVRVFRLFRFFKNLSGMQVIGQTLKASARELFLLILIVLIPMVIFSSLIYYAEKNLPVPTFGSIPEAFWWAIITMTTVGYGDVTPKSTTGKMVNALCACLGVLILALPVSVIGSNFTLYYTYAQARLSLPKRTQPALVHADKALVNTGQGTDSREGRQSPNQNADHNNVTNSGVVSRGLCGLADVVVELTVPMQRRQAISPEINPISFSQNDKGRKPSLGKDRKARTTSKGSTTSYIYPAITLPSSEIEKHINEVAEEELESKSRLMSFSSTHLEVPESHPSVTAEHVADERSPIAQQTTELSNTNNTKNNNNNDNNDNSNDIEVGLSETKPHRRQGTAKLFRFFRASPKAAFGSAEGSPSPSSTKGESNDGLPKNAVYMRRRNGNSAGVNLNDWNSANAIQDDAGSISSTQGCIPVTDDSRQTDMSDNGLADSSMLTNRSRSPTIEISNWSHTSNV